MDWLSSGLPKIAPPCQPDTDVPFPRARSATQLSGVGFGRDMGDEAQAEPRLEIIQPYTCFPPRLPRAVLSKILAGHEVGRQFRKVIVMDARTVLEFEGGHIDVALNVNIDNVDSVMGQLFREKDTTDILIVVHCEFSSHRAPEVARRIRMLDRECHGLVGYPNLSFPEVYVLDGGYCAFYREYEKFCEGGYVRMAEVSPRRRWKSQELKKTKCELVMSYDDFPMIEI